MLISVKWLEQLLGIKLEINKLKKISLSLGLEVEEEKNLAPEYIIIGKIKTLAPHPNLKNLSILQVKTNNIVQIVTAAKNVAQGDLILVGQPGGTLNEQAITEKNFNGVKSQGILISEQELGLAEKSPGVIVLEKGKPGTLFKDYFDNLVIDMSTTPNRPDWLSVRGIARELSIGLGINYQSNNPYGVKQPNRTGSFKIEINDLQGCPRYTARIFDNIEAKESPFWIKWRLHCMGINPFNNIVDITNIAMLLTGQPLHPFDLDLIKGGIIIRKARNGEEFITLEGTTLKLSKDDLIIADNNGPVALAGIIGAKRAQILSSTKKVLLESAYFDPKRIAHTSRRLGLITEASTRFERGADIRAVDQTSALTGELLKTYAQAREREFISTGKKGKTETIKFSPSRLNKILSLNLTRNQIKTLLKKIDIRIDGAKTLLAKIPHYRRDLHIEEDIYEEIARVYGYMNVPEIMPKRWGGRVTINKNHVYEETIKNYLVGQGFNETYNLSLIASRRLSDFGFDRFVKIKNPLNERFNALRPTLFLGLLDCINYNLSKGNRSLKLFEIGNILLPEAPYQEKRLGIIMGGEQYPNFWGQRNELIDYFDIKGIIESIFKILHIQQIEFAEIVKKGFSQVAAIQFSGKELGYIGCIEQSLCKESYHYVELALEQTLSFIGETFYIPSAKYPANTRDLSFLADESIRVPDVIKLITKVGGPILEKVILFDYYKGHNLPPGKKNLGFRLNFRAPDRTLTDKEVNNFIKKIEDEVSGKFNAKLRKESRVGRNK
jgi:phenylalanyl-tRNA synthetase beta chain